QHLATPSMRKLRSIKERRRVFQVYWQSLLRRRLSEIKRSEITNHVRAIERDRGRATAQVCLMAFRKLCKWHEAAHDDFNAPIARNIFDDNGPEPRERFLSDDEIRALWKCTAAPSAFHTLLRLLLLTCARRDEICDTKWNEIGEVTFQVRETNR